MMNISRKYRIYPNENQINIIENTFGCVRFVWNQMLSYAIESYDNNDFHIPNYGDIVLQYPFLDKNNKELVIDRHAISNTKQFLKASFKKYFNNIKKSKNTKLRKDGRPKYFPRFKSKKHSKNSYTNYNAWRDCKIDYSNHMIKIPVLGKVYFSPREKQIPDNWIIKNITISKTNTNKYYCSICFECHIENSNGINFINNPKNELNILGLDYSSKSLYVDSNGDCAEYPKYYRNSQKKLRILNKQLSRKNNGSNNRGKTLIRLRKLYEKISNQRKNFLHKLSSMITKYYDVICVEDIDMQNISQCLNLGKSTMDNSFGMFRNMLVYKQMRIPYHLLIYANRWYPSSKTCSSCGFINKNLSLSDRIYHCPCCNNNIDRDYNAAINLKNYALNYINETYSQYGRKFISI